MLIPLGILAAAGAGGAAAGSYELIQSTILTSTASSVTFSSIPQTYKHLQIRAVTAISAGFNNEGQLEALLNGDNSSVYDYHRVRGNGSNVASSASTNQWPLRIGQTNFRDNSNTNLFGATVIDILDYSNTSKNTTLRGFGGNNLSNAEAVSLSSALWRNTAAVTTIAFSNSQGSYVSGSRFSLYGIKG